MAYDSCPECGTKMTGFTTLFCPKEDEHTRRVLVVDQTNMPDGVYGVPFFHIDGSVEWF